MQVSDLAQEDIVIHAIKSFERLSRIRIEISLVSTVSKRESVSAMLIVSVA